MSTSEDLDSDTTEGEARYECEDWDREVESCENELSTTEPVSEELQMSTSEDLDSDTTEGEARYGCEDWDREIESCENGLSTNRACV